MSRLDDIPQDVLTAARIKAFELETFVQHDPVMNNPQGNEASEKLVDLFARAILAERGAEGQRIAAAALRCADVYEEVGGQRNIGASSAMRQFAADTSAAAALRAKGAP